MKRITSLLALMIFAATPVVAQDLSDATSNLKWREIGPTIMGGRVADIAVLNANPSTFYVGTATGGVWKTTNHGTTFEALFTEMPTSSIGDITLFQANPNVVWVGSGEPQNRQSSPWGNGVYKSTDGGKTWKNMGLTHTHHIARIQIHPSNSDVVYVAAMGHLWGQNAERGVFRTMDGGQTWEKVLYIDEMTGAIDLVMDPSDPHTLFAAMYQRQRTGYGYNGGGPSSGIYRTVDGGNSWQEMTEGLPENDKGRIGLSIYAKDPNVVFASVEARPGIGVYKSTDRGLTWERMSETNNRPMYYSQIRVDPSDPERIYMGGSNLFRSSDGGRNFTSDAAAGVHSDHHALWIDPANSDHLILGGDGGVSVTWDRGENWRQLRNLPLAQFYEVGVDNQWPYHVCGGLQDNGSWCAPNETLSNQGIRAKDWYNIGGGDGFYTVLDQENPDLMFGASQGGNIYLRNRRTWESQRLRPAPRPGENGETQQYRFNWNGPIVQSVHDPETVYLGGNHLFRSRDRGWTWEEASPDLTKAIDRETLEIMGEKLSGALLSRNDGISSYGNITSIGESALNQDLIYVGTDDGNVQVTRDGGSTWTNVADRVKGLPDLTYVSSIRASRFDEGTVYATFDGHRNDDFAAYAYVSNDYGQNWREIKDGLPDGWSVNRIYEHPQRANLLFLGNEIGVYYSIDRGAQWNRLNNNMPTVPVDDIVVQEREHDLIVGTHGRAIWIMDDITPLEELSEPVLASAAHLFSVQTAISYNVHRPQGWTPGVWVAENPAQGARIRYYVGTGLGEAPVAGEPQNSGPSAEMGSIVQGGVELVITDASGNVVRTLDGSDDLGVQEVIWDLRHEPPYVPEEQPQQQFGGFFRGAPTGPKVMPGNYTVTMTAGGATMSTEFEVKLDPRVEVSEADFMARQDAMMSAYALMKPQYEAGQAVRRIQEQLGKAQEMLTDDTPSEVRDEIQAIRKELTEIQRAMGGGGGGRRGRGGRGFSSFEGWTGRPTADALFQLDRQWERLPEGIERINAVITERMPALNRMLDQYGVRPSAGDTIEVPKKP
jgi:photosystem II stability/assembly factor-like uncharacterized protein